MHLKSLVKRNLAEGILVFAGVLVLVLQFATQKHALSEGGTDHTTIIGVPLDDVYIHCRYAENLLAGNGYSFNPGQMLSADTSPLWVLLIALGGLVTSHLDLVAVLLSAFFYLLLAPTVFRLCRDFFLLSWKWSYRVGLITLLSAGLIWASASGMEVSLACFLTLVIFGEHLRQREYGGVMRMREGVLLALGIAVRPELMLLAVILFADWLFAIVKERRGLTGLIKSGAAFVIFALPVFLIPYLERGSLIYHSSQVQGARISFVPDTGYLLFVLHVLAASFSLPILFSLAAPFAVRKQKAVSTLMIFGFGLPIVLAFVAPQFRHHGRYLFPIVPVLILLGAVAVSKIFSSSPLKKFNVCIQIASGIVALFGLWRGVMLSANSVKNINDQHLAAASWIGQNLAANDVIAADDVGAIGYFTKRQIIDLTGLVSPEIYSLRKDQSMVWKEARKQGANIFFIYTRLNPSFYNFAKDSLVLVNEFRVRLPLVASADTVMSVFRVKGDFRANR